jgi:hypothetical protein
MLFIKEVIVLAVIASPFIAFVVPPFIGLAILSFSTRYTSTWLLGLLLVLLMLSSCDKP